MRSSRNIAIVVVQQSTKTLAASDLTVVFTDVFAGKRDDVAQALMVSFLVMVIQVLPNGVA